MTKDEIALSDELFRLLDFRHFSTNARTFVQNLQCPTRRKQPLRLKGRQWLIRLADTHLDPESPVVRRVRSTLPDSFPQPPAGTSTPTDSSAAWES